MKWREKKSIHLSDDPKIKVGMLIEWPVTEYYNKLHDDDTIDDDDDDIYVYSFFFKCDEKKRHPKRRKKKLYIEQSFSFASSFYQKNIWALFSLSNSDILLL